MTLVVYQDLRFQRLPHTHKTMMIGLGVSEVLQNERVGHHPGGVAGVYAHATPAMRADLLMGLHRLWKKQHNTRPHT